MFAGLLVYWLLGALLEFLVLVGRFSLLAGAGLSGMSFHYIYTRLFHN